MDPVAHRPSWFDPATPAREDCVLKYLLDSRATRHPQRRAALFEDGSAWTYGECREHVRRAAAGLQSQGVDKGDRVLVWLPTGATQVLGWFAANYLGAVFVPLNTAYRGKVLEHVINSARATLMIAHCDLISRLAGLELPHLKRIVVVGGKAEAAPGVTCVAEAVLQHDAATLDDTAVIDHWDIQSIIYTSGTTGLSKGVLSPYLQLYTTAVVNYGYMNDGESVLVNLPMFHVGGTSPTYCALVRSGMFYLVDGFSTTRFWDQVREGECVTTSGLIGVMAAFLVNAPTRADDRDNPLRHITMAPIDERAVTLSQRYGFRYLTGFNMTEVSSPLIADLDSRVFGACGQPRSGATCRLVDDHDIEVPQGTIGELIVRCDSPWTMNAGYDGMPEATATVWRNGWFHTGDLFRKDTHGNYFFVDRTKDTIRRRGENISSFEVEAAVRSHPAISEVVAVGVASEVAEQEVLVAVTERPGCRVDPVELFEFLVPRLPYFMVPRYVRIVAEIPKTETNKPRKLVFRDEGVTPDTWDREREGLSLRRERPGVTRKD